MNTQILLDISIAQLLVISMLENTKGKCVVCIKYFRKINTSHDGYFFYNSRNNCSFPCYYRNRTDYTNDYHAMESEVCEHLPFPRHLAKDV